MMATIDAETCGFCGEYDIDEGGSCVCYRCNTCGEKNFECTCPDDDDDDGGSP